ncbi:Gfo/Idh/MocA family protein [Lentibacillus salicampi]|uniref:Gfo/Idh/MocA family oxidoreductase n=1 Tax=Lentibacillus salicampi TaxID=175306 RepID=A0A4Y9ACH9_9BACI|nr:Gfo/Idh/MocA family oxidoreductase [Lentibacillus salicampi]TFJ92094.1 Gfo/Idh/MocA family oxidoreductase [Lentibacillus salicampi]
MTLRVGITGAERGKRFYDEFSKSDEVKVVGVMDTDESVLETFQKERSVDYAVTDYEALLDTGIDIVAIAAPMQFHVQQAVQALDRDIHVLSEVTAALTLDECRKLLSAVKRSNAQYMMGENYCYIPENICIYNMVQAGLFGDIYYGEGEYLHDVHDLHHDQYGNETWRKKMQVGRPGITYGTHSLGPVLGWFDENIDNILCLGSGESRYKGYKHDDTSTMLCKMSSGALIRIRQDLLSRRPHHMRYYSLQGTKGVYEAYRSNHDIHRVWLEDYAPNSQTWQPLSDFFSKYLPFDINELSKEDDSHWGGDYLMIQDFIRSIVEGKPVTIDVYRALGMTIPGILSEESISNGGKTVSMPDIKDW